MNRLIIKKISLGLGTLIMAFQLTTGAVFSSLPACTPALVGIGIVAGSLPLTAAQCSKDQLAASAQDVLDVVNNPALQGYLRTLAPGVLPKFLALIPAATNLVTAIKNGDTSNALALVNTIFPVIEEVAASALSSNPTAMALLGVADIGLHFIINHVKASAPTAVRASRSVQVASDYGNKPVWGCQYHPKDKRCASMK